MHPLYKPKNILIVDDDINLIRSLKRWLKLHYIDCHVSTQAHHIKKLVTKLKPKLILLDLYMPRISGMAVLRKLKKDKKLKDIPVVMLTGNIDNEMALESIRLGAKGYVSKAHMVKDLIPMIYEYA